MSDQQPAQPSSQPAAPSRGLTFGPVASAYERGRPGYPAEAVTWLVGAEAHVVLELGAGTCKLTAELVRQGHAVHATDPDAGMLDVLEEQVPGCSAKQGSAEEIPANDRCVDVVVAGQAFHWFDHERALPEIARVLKPGGHLALVWNAMDQRIPWVRRLVATLGAQAEGPGAEQALVHSDLFGFVEDAQFKHWQDVNRESIVDLVRSRSWIATMPPEQADAKVAEVLALYDDYGRGMDGMQIPYVTHCFRAQVVDRDDRRAGEPDTDPDAPESPVVSDGTDTDMLLIDFR